MGLRDRAEKIIALEDARPPAGEPEQLIMARKQVRKELAAWCKAMELQEVPEYTVFEANYRGRDDDDHPSAFISIVFEIDGIRFFATFKEYMGKVTFGVAMRDANFYPVNTVEGVAAGLRRMKKGDR